MSEYTPPIATVDAALFTLIDGRLCVVLVRREAEPYKGQLALPGGYVHVDEDEDTEGTARRVLLSKTGIVAPYLEQLFTFSGKVRDPRGWSVSIAYYALVPEGRLHEAKAAVEVLPVDRLPALPFDHSRIVAKALQRLRGKASYSSLPAFLLSETFTLAELHEVYERVMGTKLDKQSFRRKIEDQSIIEPVVGAMRTGPHRPAQLYRLAAAALTEFDRTI